MGGCPATTHTTRAPCTRRERATVAAAAAAAAGAGGGASAANHTTAACFVLDTHARNRAPTHGFNLRAWLHYEAARHADVTLEPLQPHGTWAAAPLGGRQWLLRAAAHARGEVGPGGGTARHYALATAEAIAALPTEALELLLLGRMPDAPPLPQSKRAHRARRCHRHCPPYPAVRSARDACATVVAHPSVPLPGG